MNSLKSLAMNCGPLSEMIRGRASEDQIKAKIPVSRLATPQEVAKGFGRVTWNSDGVSNTRGAAKYKINRNFIKLVEQKRKLLYLT